MQISDYQATIRCKNTCTCIHFYQFETLGIIKAAEEKMIRNYDILSIIKFKDIPWYVVYYFVLIT